ncbi:kinase-like domain-containing protein [Mycena epipterygia]|nr:kinase-like domain-containing protein [Mycena epipterygia]
MPIETPVDPPAIGTKDERIRLIYQLRDLLANLHKKKIVHGDVKPHNLLMCSDGCPRFCDFDNASIEGDGFTSNSKTYPYCSQRRAQDDTGPMTRAEDMHAMGLTMWEIYTGRTPLSYPGETFEEMQEFLPDRCQAGFLPDMELVDDPAIASLIESYLAAGPHRPDIWDPNAIYCIETRFVFGRCSAEPTVGIHTHGLSTVAAAWMQSQACLASISSWIQSSSQHLSSPSAPNVTSAWNIEAWQIDVANFTR